MQHLRDLQQAGLTHVHLLPSYNFGSVPERAQDQQVPQVSNLVPLSTVWAILPAVVKKVAMHIWLRSQGAGP